MSFQIEFRAANRPRAPYKKTLKDGTEKLVIECTEQELTEAIMRAAEDRRSESNIDSELSTILERLSNVHDTMEQERIVYEAELRDRQALGLTGDEAIEHYNEWMHRFGMDHLKV